MGFGTEIQRTEREKLCLGVRPPVVSVINLIPIYT